MIFQEMLRDERAAGKEEGKVEGKVEEVLDFLQDLGNVSEKLEKRIMSETDLECLRRWIKLAARSATIEDFVSKMDEQVKEK